MWHLGELDIRHLWQQKRRSAPGDVAPPVQKYSDRECMSAGSEFSSCAPRCDGSPTLRPVDGVVHRFVLRSECEYLTPAPSASSGISTPTAAAGAEHSAPLSGGPGFTGRGDMGDRASRRESRAAAVVLSGMTPSRSSLDRSDEDELTACRMFAHRGSPAGGRRGRLMVPRRPPEAWSPAIASVPPSLTARSGTNAGIDGCSVTAAVVAARPELEIVSVAAWRTPSTAMPGAAQIADFYHAVEHLGSRIGLRAETQQSRSRSAASRKRASSVRHLLRREVPNATGTAMQRSAHGMVEAACKTLVGSGMRWNTRWRTSDRSLLGRIRQRAGIAGGRCGNPLACRDRRRRGRLNGATTRRSCVSTWGTGAPSQSRQPQTCWCDGGRNSGAANTSRAACGFCRRTGVSGITTPGVRRRPGINDSSRRGTTKPNTCADTTAHARPLGTNHQEGGRGADTRAVPWTGGAGRRRGPPAGTERLRRVRLHGTSASEWDMEGR